jgi:hypothetical protein
MAVSSKSLQASRTHPRECLAVPYLKPVRSRWSTETAQTGLAGRLNDFAWSRREMRSDNFDHPLRRCAGMKEPKISRIPQIVPTELEIDPHFLRSNSQFLRKNSLLNQKHSLFR